MQITVEISDDDAMYIGRVIDISKLSDANSHGELSFETLTKMLLDDVVLMVRRPGCWEATNMSQVFSSHGYEV